MSSCMIVASRSAHERCTGALSSAKARFNSPVRSAQESARAVRRVMAGMIHHTMNLFNGAVKREIHELCRAVLRLRLVAGAAQAVGDVRSTTVRHPCPVLQTIGTVLAQP